MPERQIWHPYTSWEDWLNGMWGDGADADESDRALFILYNLDIFLDAARKMVQDWPNSAEQNLTDMGQNRRAWIGQAACSWLAKVPESATRAAWWKLTPEERNEANAVADQVIEEWEESRSPALFTIPTQRGLPTPTRRVA